MKSLKSYITEQVKIENREGLLAQITQYKKEGEILNPDYVRLTDAAKRLYGKDSKATQMVALNQLHDLRGKGIENPIIQDFYYSISDSMIVLGKLQKMVDKVAKDNDPAIKVVSNAVNKLISDWKQIAGDLKELKTKVVKVTQKREQARTVAAVETQRKFADSSSLVKVLESHIEEYKKRAHDEAKRIVDYRIDLLQKADWDINKVAPRSYDKTAAAKRSAFEAITKATSYAPRRGEPDIRKPDQSLIDRFIKMNVDNAEAAYLEFIHKMVTKVGKPVVNATMTGNIWTNATLTVKCDDGEEQTWKTQMILNFSKYQTMFNQFPSRRVK